ncbi:MAG: CerR family C-terminal domain-containing protein [Burkholderiales bacterium]|nr:CerR family C-terminal domain-containing protein [Burkholderiales bacterium]MDE2454426.1 CerR family C-terminal domain-containing protein [Burkholderiales bacterium]
MSNPLHPPAAPRRRSVRSDGAETRAAILRCAAGVFAEKGYARSTSREVCAAAGCNLAAVNYHFGSKAGLYQAVLVQAHDQLVALDALEAIRHGGAAATEQLRSVIALFLRRPGDPLLARSLRVLVQELMAPTEHAERLLREAVLPKVRLMRGLVAALLGVPEDRPVVQRGLAFVILPCIMLVIAPPSVLGRALPALTADRQALLDDLGAYALAGLESMKHRPDSTTRKVDAT